MNQTPQSIHKVSAYSFTSELYYAQISFLCNPKNTLRAIPCV